MTRLLCLLTVVLIGSFAVGSAHASVTTRTGGGSAVTNGKIAFDSSRSPGDSTTHGIYTINADGTGLSQLTSQNVPGCSGCGNSDEPAFSPDGTQIAFNTKLFPAGAHCCETLGIMNADGSNQRLLIAGETTICGFNEWPAWSPDGQQIVFGSCNNGPSTLAVVNADGTGFRILKQFPDDVANEVLHPSWSPDGSTIVYERLATNGWHIFTTSALDGSGETDLGLGFDPAYSPDGATIAFDMPRGSNDTGLWMMNVDGSNRRQITHSFDYEPAWSPDGTRIAFGSQRTGFALIWTSNPDGSDPTPVTAPSDGIDADPSWQNGGGSGGGDTAPPAVTVDPPAPTGQNGWSTGNVVVQVHAADDTSVASIDCSPFILSPSNGFGTPAAGGQLTITQDGTTNIVCTATDAAGNTSQPATAQIEIDRIAPQMSPLWSTPVHVGETITPDPQATDATSGVAGASCDPLDTTTATPPGVVRGENCTATDNAGNVEHLVVPYTVDPAPDQTPPSLAPTISPSPVLLHATAVATPHASDASGIASQSCGPVDTGSVGIHTATCTASDNAGNVGTATITYLVQYKPSFVFPLPAMPLHAGLPVPIALRLTDAGNVPIPDAEAQALVAAPCRLRLAATGVQTFDACPGYIPLLNLFAYAWLTHPTPKGAVTLAVTITYPGGQQVVTKETELLH